MEELLFIDSDMIYGYGYMGGCPWGKYYDTHHSIRQQFIINPILGPHFPKNIATGKIFYNSPIHRGTLVVFGIPNGFYDGDGI